MWGRISITFGVAKKSACVTHCPGPAGGENSCVSVRASVCAPIAPRTRCAHLNAAADTDRVISLFLSMSTKYNDERCLQSVKKAWRRSFPSDETALFHAKNKKAKLMELFRDFCYCCYRWKWECIYRPRRLFISTLLLSEWVSARAQLYSASPRWSQRKVCFDARGNRAQRTRAIMFYDFFGADVNKTHTHKTASKICVMVMTIFLYATVIFCAKLFLRRKYRYYNLPRSQLEDSFKIWVTFWERVCNREKYALFSILKPRT